MRRAYLSLGTNIENRYGHLASAIPLVVGADEYRVSQVYETEPVGGVAQDDFWNLVVELTTSASAYELLARARTAEAAAGRTREVRWGPRTLDVDVLLVGDEVLDDPELTIPHPRLYERAFVLAPLAELAPGLVSDDQRARAVGAVRVLGTLQSLH